MPEDSKEMNYLKLFRERKPVILQQLESNQDAVLYWENIWSSEIEIIWVLIKQF